MTVVDPLAAVRTFLLADAGVIAAVGPRVFAGELPDVENGAMPRACVVLEPAGGPAEHGYQDYGKSRIDAWSYGGNMHEAYLVYLAVYEALKQLRRQKIGNVLVHAVEPSSKGASGRDPVKQWPLCLSSYLVQAAEIVAA